MTLKELLIDELVDMNISELAIDKDSEYQGDKATKISFVMTDPGDLKTGPLSFEVWFTDKIHVSNEKKAILTRTNAYRQAQAFLFDREAKV